MKTNLAILTALGVLAFGAQIAEGQGSFINLNFESPVPPLIRNAVFEIPVSNAMPGWTAFVGGNSVSTVVYDTTTIDAAAVTFQSLASGFSIIQGNYSVYLQSATEGVPAGSPLSAAIGQAGIIPSGAVSLFFLAGFGVPQVTFGGNLLSVAAVGSQSGYTRYGANIASYAGQSDELLFSVTRSLNGTRQQVLLDAISFSSTAIPEPSMLSLFGLGLLGLGWQWRRMRGQ